MSGMAIALKAPWIQRARSCRGPNGFPGDIWTSDGFGAQDMELRG
jgi:hypothetical protein